MSKHRKNFDKISDALLAAQSIFLILFSIAMFTSTIGRDSTLFVSPDFSRASAFLGGIDITPKFSAISDSQLAQVASFATQDVVITNPVAHRLQGFGTNTPGGRDGTPFVVTSLLDSGPGTLRDALSQGNRHITFAVGGTINLTTDINILGAFITIDGASAPIPGITLVGHGLRIRGSLGAHDIIVQGIRIRDPLEDGIQIAAGAYNIVIDHVSVQGALDENIGITQAGTKDITVSWSIIGRPRKHDSEPQGRKNILVGFTSTRVSLHHNIIADGFQRNPLAKYSDDPPNPPIEDTNTTLELKNNIIWGWGSGTGTYIHSGTHANVIANYYHANGSDHQAALQICKEGATQGGPACQQSDPTTFARAYVAGNYSTREKLVPEFELNDRGTETEQFPGTSITSNQPGIASCLVVAGASIRPLDQEDLELLNSITSNPEFTDCTSPILADYYIQYPIMSPVAPSEGRNIKFRVSVANDGYIIGKDSIATLRIDEHNDGTWDYAFDQRLDAISARGKKTIKWNGLWETVRGIHKYEICVDTEGEDANGVINELFENNNCISSVFNVKAKGANLPQQPDLLIERVRTSPRTFSATKTPRWVVYVRNSSSYSADYAGRSHVRLRLDENNDGSIDMESFTPVSELSPNRKRAIGFNGVWTPKVGVHRYELCVDINGEVVEADENNNCIDTVFNITGSLSDFSEQVAVTLTGSLREGDRGEEVLELQRYLAGELFLDEEDVTGFYGSKTKQAVADFQDYYSEEILEPLNLEEGTGFFGLSTLEFLQNGINKEDNTPDIISTVEIETPSMPESDYKPEPKYYLPETSEPPVEEQNPSLEIELNKEFPQIDFLLPPTIIEEPAGIACPFPALTSDLKRGPRSRNFEDQTMSLQRFLWQYRSEYDWGMNNIPIDQFAVGVYGSRTEDAVKGFQREFMRMKPGDDGYGKVFLETRNEILNRCANLISSPIDETHETALVVRAFEGLLLLYGISTEVGK